MILQEADIEKIAHLSRLKITQAEIASYCAKLSNILEMAKQMDKIDTSSITPMSHPLDMSQPLREDVVTEVDQHLLFLNLAPLSDADLYLVPQVIET